MIDWLNYRDGTLFAEGVSLQAIAERFGTPTYVYSRSAITGAFAEFASAAAGRKALICYALKANSNLAVIELLARAGAGFDIVSEGELQRVLAAGGDAGRIVFSGVGKGAGEIKAALRAGVRCFNVESRSELQRLSDIACALGRRAPMSLRVNPDVDAGTHPYISTGLRENKFGIAHDEAVEVYRFAASLPGIEIAGIDCHIGSQFTRDRTVRSRRSNDCSASSTHAARAGHRAVATSTSAAGSASVTRRTAAERREMPTCDLRTHRRRPHGTRTRDPASSSGRSPRRQCRPAADPRRIPEAPAKARVSPSSTPP
jgi:diaminopimelate decarboxylase